MMQTIVRVRFHFSSYRPNFIFFIDPYYYKNVYLRLGISLFFYTNLNLFTKKVVDDEFKPLLLDRFSGKTSTDTN